MNGRFFPGISNGGMRINFSWNPLGSGFEASSEKSKPSFIPTRLEDVLEHPEERADNHPLSFLGHVHGQKDAFLVPSEKKRKSPDCGKEFTNHYSLKSHLATVYKAPGLHEKAKVLLPSC
jgi:hypothetical protein